MKFINCSLKQSHDPGLSDVIRCYQMLSDVIRCYQMLSDVIRCYQGFISIPGDSTRRHHTQWLAAAIGLGASAGTAGSAGSQGSSVCHHGDGLRGSDWIISESSRFKMMGFNNGLSVETCWNTMIDLEFQYVKNGVINYLWGIFWDW